MMITKTTMIMRKRRKPITRYRYHSLAFLLLVILPGCGQLLHRFVTPVPEGYVPNPLELPDGSPEFVQRQVVDTLDDYFRIAAEQPVVRGPGVLIDGRVETVFQAGGSILEPWRKDSLPGFERLQGTFQSIRRRAIANIPAFADRLRRRIDRPERPRRPNASRRHHRVAILGAAGRVAGQPRFEPR